MNDDLEGFLVKALGPVMGVAAAELYAPQFLILAAACAGAVFGLMSWHKCTRRDAVGYVLLFTFVGWLLAHSIARLAVAAAAEKLKLNDVRPFVVPCAFAISCVGHRWEDVLRWLVKTFGPTPK